MTRSVMRGAAPATIVGLLLVTGCATM